MNILFSSPTLGMRQLARWLMWCFLSIGLAACGGGGGGALVAPAITAQPANTSVNEGAVASFSVAATGSDPLSYQWQKNGTAIPGATSASYSTAATVAADNTGSFTVVVSNAAGSVTSAAAVLSVGPPTASGSLSYVLAETERDGIYVGPGRIGSYATLLQVFDPKLPGPVQTVDLGTSSAGAAEPLTTQSYTVDRAAKRSVYNGEAMVLYALGGKVWKIDLRSGASHVPTQISSMTNACGIVQSFAIDAAGATAWLEVNECPGAAHVFVRTSMSASTPPVTIAGPATIWSVLDDGAKNALGLLMVVNHAWEFRSAVDLSRISAVVNPPTASEFLPIGYDYSTLQAAYYRTGNSLARLSWPATSATFEPATYTFSSAFSFEFEEDNGTSDGSALYFGDGNRLLKVIGSAVPVPVVTVTGSPVYFVLTTSTHVVVQSANPSIGATPSITVVPKAGGVPIDLPNASLLGVAEGKLVHIDLSDGMTHVRNLDGTGNLAAGKAGFVYQRSRPADQALIDSLLVCEPSLSTDSFCNNGQLVQSDLSLTSRTVLGNVSHAPTSPGGTLSLANSLGNVFPTAGLPSLATFLTTPDSKNTAPRQVTDFYSLTPSTSGSLLRLTTQVP